VRRKLSMRWPALSSSIWIKLTLAEARIGLFMRQIIPVSHVKLMLLHKIVIVSAGPAMSPGTPALVRRRCRGNLDWWLPGRAGPQLSFFPRPFYPGLGWTVRKGENDAADATAAARHSAGHGFGGLNKEYTPREASLVERARAGKQCTSTRVLYRSTHDERTERLTKKSDATPR